MNFLLRSSSTQQQSTPSTPTSFGDEPLVDEELRNGFTNFGSGPSQLEAGGDSDAELQQHDMVKLKNRVIVEGHSDVSTKEGSVLIPCRELPEDWTSSPDSAKLRDLDRAFVFPGEQLNILVTVSPKDLSGTEIITPFEVAAAINKNSLLNGSSATESGSQDELAARQSLREEGQKRRNAQVLESFRKSHFYVKLSASDEEELEAIEEPVVDKREGKPKQNVLPVVMENDGFDPFEAGGIARRAIHACSLANGDIVVALKVAVAARTSIGKAVLEVLQYEHKSSVLSSKPSSGQPVAQPSGQSLERTQEILHWLLPLDRFAPSTTIQASVTASPAPATGSTSQRLSFGGANSTLFSFGHLRSSSQGSLPQVTTSGSNLSVPPYPASALSIPPDEWNRLYPAEPSSSQEASNEALLSFRGVPLEPRRFFANCGLEGLHVPGKRWSRKITVVQPLAVESYFADCNTEDLICVLVENVLPSHMFSVAVFVDSICIICESAGPGSHPQPVPFACVECGEGEKLPNLPLRIGEQHSFILKPTSTMKASKSTARQSKDLQTQAESGNYAVLVSCHCSHTQAKFYVKHPLKWKPRSPRDLLVSVVLENTTRNLALPQLKSQVVTIQATNLSSRNMDLMLLAPSTMAGPLPHPTTSKPRVGSSHSFHTSTKEGEKNFAPSRSLSTPPRVEKERATSPVKDKEAAATTSEMFSETSQARTHLWLQSRVPLGHVPAHSTTVVKADLLPLTDGIINLDTLHFASKDHGEVLYIPENALRIHSDSSIANVVSRHQ